MAGKYIIMTNFMPKLAPVMLPRAIEILNSPSKPHFRKTYESMFGMKLGDVCPDDKLEEALIKVKTKSQSFGR